MLPTVADSGEVAGIHRTVGQLGEADQDRLVQVVDVDRVAVCYAHITFVFSTSQRVSHIDECSILAGIVI